MDGFLEKRLKEKYLQNKEPGRGNNLVREVCVDVCSLWSGECEFDDYTSSTADVGRRQRATADNGYRAARRRR